MRPLFNTIIIAAAAVVLLTMGGCGPSLKVSGMKGTIEPGSILDLKAGKTITEDELLTKLSQYQMVVIGEVHNHPEQHRRQLEIVRALWQGNSSMVIGLEIFTKKYQGLLDRWVAGTLEPEDFYKEIMENILDPGTLMVYRPLLDWARENSVTLLALNAPRDIVVKVAREGILGLNTDERLSLPTELVMGPVDYRDRVVAVHSMHPGKTDPENFFAAQVVKDETMAQAMADYMISGKGAGRRGVVITGNEHVINGYGIPGRLQRTFLAPVATLLMPLSTDGDRLDAKAANFAWISKPVKRRRLGVVLKKNDAGYLVIQEVVKGTEAERIGLKPGDILISMDGEDLKDLMAMHRAAVEGGPDKEHTLVFDRDDTRIEKTFRFR